MIRTSLIPSAQNFRIKKLVMQEAKIKGEIESTIKIAKCPKCQEESKNIQSRYERKIADLPWATISVELKIRVRRFCCRNQKCNQKIFSEPLSEVAGRYRRKTIALEAVLSLIAKAEGAEQASITAIKLGVNISPDTMLRLLRRQEIKKYPTSEIKVVGIDDWAIKKGNKYATIIVDLEKRKPLELLPDTEPKTVEKWLKAHPNIEVISRDRGNNFIEAASKAAPQAQQVADRWHLFHNLMEALINTVKRNNKVLKEAAKEMSMIMATSSNVEVTSLTTLPKSPGQVAKSQKQRQYRMSKYEQTKVLHKEGLSIAAIAKQVGSHRETIRNYIRSESFPERLLPAPKPNKKIEGYLSYLQLRWQQGCYNGRQLFREIEKRGYSGSKNLVYKYMKSWRRFLPEEFKRLRSSPSFSPLTPKQVAWLLIKEMKDLEDEEKSYISIILRLNPEIKKGQLLAKYFHNLIKKDKETSLDDFLKQVKENSIEEFDSFAKGLIKDEKAVRAAFSSSWSNGQVEGQINRLKMIKRQGFGRAKLDLLQARFLPT